MTIYLPQPPARPHDGKGWNRLSLNAHMDDRDQCGLQPLNHAALRESATGRQRYGGFGRCSRQGRCPTCPVQRAHLDQQGLVWPPATPALVARILPWPLDPMPLFADPAAGRSNLSLVTWPAPGTNSQPATWIQIRNTSGLLVGRAFRDRRGAAFWLLHDHPGITEAVVRTKRIGYHVRHALYARSGGPRLAVLTCAGPCAHTEVHLRHLAGDLSQAPTRGGATRQAALPRSIPGAPGVQLEYDGTVVLHRHGTTTRFTFDVWTAGSAAALIAYAVRLCAEP
ncbi:hypothetical protein [Streptacidiphilus sp. EB103A]|uniref:hypothetical protein n=1 Tax=Streptacidiphilus sp. EB103A TaxID=3156275 RepID=UPI0035172C89